MEPTEVQRTFDALGVPEHLLGFGPEMATAGRAAGAAGKVISAGYRRTFAISAKGRATAMAERKVEKRKRNFK